MNKGLKMRHVNGMIRDHWPLIYLEKGNGYFYLASNDEGMALKLAGLYTTSIPVCKLTHLSVQQWKESVEYVLRDSDRPQSDRSPII